MEGIINPEHYYHMQSQHPTSGHPPVSYLPPPRRSDDEILNYLSRTKSPPSIGLHLIVGVLFNHMKTQQGNQWMMMRMMIRSH